MFEVLLFDGGTLRLSEEFALGHRELRRRIHADRWWHAGAGNRPIPPAHFLKFCHADRILVILDPAVLVADNLVDELLGLTPGGQVACALPADPRSAGAVAVDYASRPGFDRHVARRSRLPAAGAYTGQAPWLPWSFHCPPAGKGKPLPAADRWPSIYPAASRQRLPAPCHHLHNRQPGY